MRRLNLVFLAVLLAVVTVFGGGMHLVHGFQIKRNAKALKETADRAETANDLDKAEQSLRQYLNIRSEDGPAWESYARVLDKRDAVHRRRDAVLMAYEQALQRKLGDLKLERRCADIALELQWYNEAQRHLTNLILNAPKDSQGKPAAAELAELEDMLGQCDRGLGRFKDAEKRFVQALKYDPRRVASYDRLARLRRNDLRQNQAADGTIQEMVAKNPSVGLAYAFRSRYSHEFLLSAPAEDIQLDALRSSAARDIDEALKLAPDDTEVLLIAAVASKEKPDLATARAHFERGFKLDPKNVWLALGLAYLETEEHHPDKAEAVLRRAFHANQSLRVAFDLARNLILQGKIEGTDNAAHYIALFRIGGHSETYVRYLEAQILFQAKKWAEAIPKLEMARAFLGDRPQLVIDLDMWLAECHGRMGDEEQRLNALRRAAAGGRGPDSARMDALALARSGKFDQALTVFEPLALRKPEWRLDLVRLQLQKAIRQPRDQQNWQEVERYLLEAEKELPREVETLALLRVEMFAAQGRLEDARSLLSSVHAKDPQNLQYRLALARVTQRLGDGAAALQVINQAEKDLGPKPGIQLARLEYWGMAGGVEAKAAVAKLAGDRQQIAAAERPSFLRWLGSAEIRLGELDLGRKYWRELADLKPDDLAVRLGLFELALAAKDHAAAAGLVDEIRKAEGDEGLNWQYLQAALLIDKVRRGASENLDEARALTLKITERHPRWPSGFALKGDIAELAGSTDQAIEDYLSAVKLGNVQPALLRKLVGLLIERNRVDEIKDVEQVLLNQSQGATLDEIKFVEALDAMGKKDFDRGIALARQVFPNPSTNYSDHLTLGRFYMTAGRTDEAAKEFRRATELGPGVPLAWLTYVQYLVQAKQIDQATAAVMAARKALPADRATLTLAQCWLLVGDAKQAGDLIAKAMNDEGKSADPAALRLAAIVYFSQNRPDEVNKYLDRLDQLANILPGDKAWSNRVRMAVLLSKGRPADRDQALALADQNLGKNPDSFEDQRLKAMMLAFRPNGGGEAIKILERLAGENRLGGNERFLLAQLYLDQREEPKYQDEMLKLLNLKPRNAQHLVHFVNHWIDRNQLDQADRWLAQLKKDDPRGLPALKLEARLLDLRKRRPELLALLEARGREVPDEIGAVADLLNRHGFAKEAELAYKAFIARDLKQPERSLALAKFLARQDRVSEAMDLLTKAWSTCRPEQVAFTALPLYDAPSAGEAEKRQIEAWVSAAVQKRPDAVGLAANLGVIWIQAGRFGEAEALYRRILGNYPDNRDALNGLAWLLALRDQVKADEALGLITKAVEIYGPSSTLVDTLGVVQIRAGKLDQAVEQLTNAQQRDSENSSLARHLAWAYKAKGKSEEARREFLKAEKLGLKIQALDPLERAIVQKLRHELFPG